MSDEIKTGTLIEEVAITKPIVQIKFLNMDTSSMDNEEAMERTREMMNSLSAYGYIPIVTSSDVEFTMEKPDNIIASVNGTSVTVADLINTKINKTGTAEITYTEAQLIEAIKTGAERIKLIDQFIDNLNAKIQMIFPNNTEMYSAIVLSPDYRQHAALSGQPVYSIQSNNPIFTATVNKLIEVNKDEETGDCDVLNVLTQYLDAKIREAMVEDSKVIKRDKDGNPETKVVSPDEVAEGLKSQAEELKTEESIDEDSSEE